MSEEQFKQDCEIKAFRRLLAKIKERYPRPPILLLGDSLYVDNFPIEQDKCSNMGTGAFV